MRRSTSPDNWDYQIKAFYSARAKAPNRPGSLAIHTWHIGEASKDAEVADFKRRGDIAYIEIASRADPFHVETITIQPGARA